MTTQKRGLASGLYGLHEDQSASEVYATANVLVQHYVLESIWETRD